MPPSPSRPLPPIGSVYSGISTVGGGTIPPSPSRPLPPIGSVYSGISTVGGSGSFGV